MDAQWRAAIAANVPWIEILTWNDFNKSYLMPMDDFEKYHDWGFPIGFTKPSLGYAELLRYLSPGSGRGTAINRPRCRVLVLPNSTCFSSCGLPRFAQGPYNRTSSPLCA